jgi:hypothetical protein
MPRARKLNGSVIANVCKYAEEIEVPGIFALWSGIASVSAALGRNCFIDQGYFTVYPNTYIVLVAGSARSKKSTAIIELCYEFVRDVKPPIKLLSQKMTPEALISSLSGASQGSTVTVLHAAVGTAIADELATFVNRDGFKNGMIDLLTKLYDCKDFPYETRLHGIETVRNPCLCIYGGITMERLKMTIPTEAVGSGFTSRIVFVYKDKSDNMVPWPSLSEENKLRKQLIVHDLGAIAEMRGPMVLTADAREVHDREYVSFAQGSPLSLEPSLYGYVGRRDRTLLKLAMIVNASRTDDRVITANDFIEALTYLADAESSMARVFRAVDTTEIGQVTERVVAYMMRNKIVTRASLVLHFRHLLDASRLYEVMKTLEQAGIARAEVDGATVRYIYTGA